MASISTAALDKLFHLPSSFKFPIRKMNQRINLVNTGSLIRLLSSCYREQSSILPHMSQVSCSEVLILPEK